MKAHFVQVNNYIGGILNRLISAKSTLESDARRLKLHYTWDHEDTKDACPHREVIEVCITLSLVIYINIGRGDCQAHCGTRVPGAPSPLHLCHRHSFKKSALHWRLLLCWPSGPQSQV